MCFKVLSTVQKTRVSRAALWCNSLLQIFGNGMLYCLGFMTEALIRRIHRDWLSIWGQCRGFEKCWMNSMVIIKVWQLGGLTLIVPIRTNFFLWDPGHDWPDSSKSIRFIARDMSVWVSYQAGSAWRHLVFFMKGPVLIKGHEGHEERLHCKTFEETPTGRVFILFKWEKNSVMIWWYTRRTTIGLLCPYNMNWQWWKQNSQSTSCWWSVVMVILCFYSASYMASHSTWMLTLSV